MLAHKISEYLKLNVGSWIYVLQMTKPHRWTIEKFIWLTKNLFSNEIVNLNKKVVTSQGHEITYHVITFAIVVPPMLNNFNLNCHFSKYSYSSYWTSRKFSSIFVNISKNNSTIIGDEKKNPKTQQRLFCGRYLCKAKKLGAIVKGLVDKQHPPKDQRWNGEIVDPKVWGNILNAILAHYLEEGRELRCSQG